MIYKANVNIAWLSLQSPTPELPLSDKKKEALKALYSGPRPLDGVVNIGLDKDSTAAEVASRIKSCELPLAQPAEKLHAWWAALADAIRDADCDGSDDASLAEWLRCCRAQLCVATPLSDGARAWQSMQAREDLATEFEALRTTPLMRVLHFAAFKEALEKARGPQSAQVLTAEYGQRLRLSARSEPITAGWVDSACTFLNRMFALPACRAVLVEADDLPAGTNPLEGTTRLQAIISKAKTAERITLVVEALLDMRKAGFLPLAWPICALRSTDIFCQALPLHDMTVVIVTCPCACHPPPTHRQALSQAIT